MSKTTGLIYWVARIVAAMILVQTLYFKFSGAEESVYIFSKVGMEPWGRIGVGVLELVAAGLLLITSVAWLGAILSAGLMAGAVMMHLTMLGISVKDDGGYLFFLAVTVLACNLVVLFLDREKITKLFRAVFKFS